jgi:ATP-dependent exoDNAse (exonuclease V) alpha subunit
MDSIQAPPELTTIKLSPKQQHVFDGLLEYALLPNNKKYVTFGGLAGVGKTTLICVLIDELHKKNMSVAVATFTGKASIVVKAKLINSRTDYCGTIHSLIYQSHYDNYLKRFIHERVDKLPYDIIIIDEASMVTEELFETILSYRLPVIAVGDHGQLPPVTGSFNILSRLDFKLEEIVRQACDNPIIKLSMLARTGETIPYGDFGSGVKKVYKPKLSTLLPHVEYSPKTHQIICGTNKLRIAINSYIRHKYVSTSAKYPVIGDKVICLRNNKDTLMFNGMIGDVVHVKGLDEIEVSHSSIPRSVIDAMNIDVDDTTHIPIYVFTVMMHHDGKEYTVKTCPMQYNQDKTRLVNMLELRASLDLFDYAYAITTHKSQGSEYSDVVLVNERIYWDSAEMHNRWLYTAITRAKERLTIIDKQDLFT